MCVHSRPAYALNGGFPSTSLLFPSYRIVQNHCPGIRKGSSPPPRGDEPRASLSALSSLDCSGGSRRADFNHQ
jgi:hypothetical protein